MAKIVVYKLDDMLKILGKEGAVSEKTHIAVTDELTYVILVPITTSRHRHYIEYREAAKGSEERIRKILDELKKKGIKIVTGHVEFVEK